jgi:SAM-dependent methyltransferase
MNGNELPGAAGTAIARQVSAFYECHPYPPPVDDLQAYRQIWDDRRRRAESHLFWPAEPYRDDRSILVAGCGTTQAAHYALRWPRAQVIGIEALVQIGGTDMRMPDAPYNIQARSTAFQTAGAVLR